MWAEFDITNFPHVKVKLNKNIENDEDFQLFLDKWMNLYDYNTYFTLTFDTTEVGWVSPKYAFKMASFINRLKERKKEGKEEFLQYSNIYYSSWYVKYLLKMIFFLQSPVAPVYIYPKEQQQEEVVLEKKINIR
jgi:hypothetical protein